MFIRAALLLLGVLAVQAGFSFFQALSFASVGQRSLVDLRRDTYARLITLPMTFFAQRRVGELASRLSADLTQIEDTLIVVLPQLLRQITMLTGGIALIAFTSLKNGVYRRLAALQFREGAGPATLPPDGELPAPMAFVG